MEKKHYAQLDETLYTETLDNGLKVTLLPKNDFHKTYSLFTTNYGSIDNSFIPLGKSEKVTVPDGIAHFLEHKMFEKKREIFFMSLVNMELLQMHLPVLLEQVIFFQVPITF